jgi:hypothetical protein
MTAGVPENLKDRGINPIPGGDIEIGDFIVWGYRLSPGEGQKDKDSNSLTDKLQLWVSHDEDNGIDSLDESDKDELLNEIFIESEISLLKFASAKKTIPYADSGYPSEYLRKIAFPAAEYKSNQEGYSVRDDGIYNAAGEKVVAILEEQQDEIAKQKYFNSIVAISLHPMTTVGPVSGEALVSFSESLENITSNRADLVSKRIPKLIKAKFTNQGGFDENKGLPPQEINWKPGTNRSKESFDEQFPNIDKIIGSYEDNLELDYGAEGVLGTTFPMFSDLIFNVSIPNYYTSGKKVEDISFQNTVAAEAAAKDLGVEQKNISIEKLNVAQQKRENKEDEAKKKNRARREELKISEQALLLNNVAELSDINRQMRIEHGSGYYNNFACIDAKDRNGLNDFINVLTSPLDMVALFERLKPEHIASMIPIVKIYKTPWTMNGGVSTYTGKNIEFEFEEFSDKDILKRSLGTGTGVNMVSFDFNFNGDTPFKADKQMDANMVIRSQSIDYIAQERMSKEGEKYSFSELFIPAELSTKTRNVKNSTIPTPGGAKVNPKDYAIRAFVHYAIDDKSPVWRNDEKLKQCVKNLKLSINLALTYHEIDLQEDGSLLVNASYIGRLDAEMKDTDRGNILPALAPREEYKELLKMRNKYKKEDKTNYEAAIQALETELVKLKNNSTGSSVEDLDPNSEQIKLLKEKIKLLKDNIESKDILYKPDTTEEDWLRNYSEATNQKKVYRDFLRNIIAKKGVNVAHVDINTLNVKDFNMTIKNTQISSEEQGAAKLEVEINNEMFGDYPSLNVSPETESSMMDLDTLADAAKNQTASKLQGPIGNIKDKVRQLQDDNNIFSDTFQIKYFYFGDIVEAAIESFNANNQESPESLRDFRTILGPIEIKMQKERPNDQADARLDPKTGKIVGVTTDDLDSSVLNIAAAANPDVANMLSASTGSFGPDKQLTEEGEKKVRKWFKDQKIDAITETVPVVINIADIPISLNRFLEWFSTSIIDKGKLRYRYDEFLKDASTKLIQEFFTTKSESVLLPEIDNQLRMTTFSCKTNNKFPYADEIGFKLGDDPQVGTPWTSMVPSPGPYAPMNFPIWEMAPGQLAYIESLRADNRLPLFKPGLNKVEKNAHMADYCVLYGDPASSRKRKVDYNNDVANGVYHFRIGTEAGPVKNIKVSVDDWKAYEAAGIQNALNRETDHVTLRSRVYSATLELQGVTFLRPGQKIYVHPAAFGTDENLQKFGLAAYFTIITVSNRIGIDGYTTSLTCRFHEWGTSK